MALYINHPNQVKAGDLVVPRGFPTYCHEFGIQFFYTVLDVDGNILTVHSHQSHELVDGPIKDFMLYTGPIPKHIQRERDGVLGHQGYKERPKAHGFLGVRRDEVSGKIETFDFHKRFHAAIKATYQHLRDSTARLGDWFDKR